MFALSLKTTGPLARKVERLHSSSSSSLQGHPGLFITHNDPRESTDKHVIKAPLTLPSREDLSTSIRLITFRELMPAYQQQSKETFHVKELSASDKRIQPTESKHRFQFKAIAMLTVSVLFVGTLPLFGSAKQRGCLLLQYYRRKN